MNETQAQTAERIARKAHKGQKCTVTGEPYIHHVERVAAMVEGDEAKAVAWLHDVIEDTDYRWKHLDQEGVSERVTDAVWLLTRKRGDPYDIYIDSIQQGDDALAITVKLADLRDHLRPDCPERLRARYERAWLALTGEVWSSPNPQGAGEA